MLFNTPEFFLFLGAVLLLFYVLPFQARKPLLLAASYFFYMSWIPKFILLLVALTLIDYAAAVWIASTDSQRRRKAALIISLCANLGLLGFFKYYNFFATTIAHVLGRPADSFAMSITLPLGISFHTFQSVSYVIDVYRREQKPVRNLLDYALFISFFPQLVAGPIVRAREFFGDLEKWRPPQSAEVSYGVLLVLFGLAKKVVVADRFAQISDAYFKSVHTHPGALTAWSGMLAFGVQIFFDFSGYTDMAIGMAALFGFHFPENFRRPYLATSITDFWRRWHMSLSRWLRDYLYIPLGGNRGSRWKTYRNLMITMLLGGLWHGASWNFVVWGGYYGLLLSIERVLRLARPITMLLTFPLVLIGWIFFRAATLPDSLYVLGEAFRGSAGSFQIPEWLMILLAITFVLALTEEFFGWFKKVAEGPAWVYGIVGALVLMTIELLGYSGPAVPFVYFQF